jgi:ketosteroid isomerase-like protein
MSDVDSALQAMCDSYAGAVSASDSARYAKLFTDDAIRMPPGAEPEYGPEQIQKAEQADYGCREMGCKNHAAGRAADCRRVDIRGRGCRGVDSAARRR